MSCSIGTLVGSECGTTSSKLNITQETIPISLCQKDVSKHLHTISVTDISTEYDLVPSRAGVFEYDEDTIYQEQQCAQSTDISLVEDGSRKESVATQTQHRQSQARS